MNLPKVLFLLIVLCVPVAYAEEEKEYDFSWLDPDKKIYVLQNRRYKKSQRLELNIAGGLALNNTLVSSKIISARGIYYISEEWGVNAFYSHKFNSKSDEAEHFEENTNFRGLPRYVNWYSGFEAVWIPFYAKVNSFNHIFYIDFGASLGLAYLETEADRNLIRNVTSEGAIETDQTAGITGSIFQKYFINEHFGVRYELTALIYQADTVTPFDSVKTREKETNVDWDFLVSLSMVF